MEFKKKICSKQTSASFQKEGKQVIKKFKKEIN